MSLILESSKRISHDYFQYEELNTIILSYLNNITLEDIMNIAYYYLQRHDKISLNNQFFKFFKKKFIQLFFPLISDPDNHEENYKLIGDNFKLINKISLLGPPFNKYLEDIQLYFIKRELDKKKNEFKR